MIKKIYQTFKELYQKYKEIINYLIFGFLTTVISLGTYYLLTWAIFDPNNPIELQITNVISWITAVNFAYFTNRKYVFNSKNKKILSEMIKFYLARIVSLLVDMLLMYILVSRLKYNDKIMKVIVQIVVIVLNYVFSKVIIFKKSEGEVK